MYCPKCGTFLEDDCAQCVNCGEPIVHEQTAQANQPNNDNYYQQNNAGTYYNPQPSESQSYYQYDSQAKQAQMVEQGYKDKLSSSNTLGILAIILGILFSPIVGIICGAIGISKLNEVPDFAPYTPLAQEKARCKKLNTLGIVIPIVLWVVAIVFMLVIMFAFGFAATSAAWY